jgi:hypothetical protein
MSTPYPYLYRHISKVWKILVLIFVLSFVFSYFFEPFEVNRAEHKLNYFWICVIHALLPMLIAIIYFSIYNGFLKDDSKWTIGKEAKHLSILLVLFGLGSFLVRDLIYDKPDNWEWRYLIEELSNTLGVGILILLIVLPVNLQRLQYKYRIGEKTFQFPVSQMTNQNNCIEIKSSIPSENLELDINKLIYVKVDGNYLDLFIKSEEGLEKKMIRQSLKTLSNQLQNYPHIFQCHRSYLVNLSQVQKVSGNAQGFSLSLYNDTVSIPVSRSKIEAFQQQAHLST